VGRSFQDAHLRPALSVADGVALGVERSGPDPDTVAADVDDVLDAFGLTDRRADPIGALSAGARRVVEVAVAVASRPAVALLDEPSEGVGHVELEALADTLRGLAGRWAGAVVFIEHDLHLVRSVATRRIVLTNGEIVLDRRLGATPER
jgi:branched-chain amino acid transport system ATP-binding protein